ncbi:MAG: hypothetical protein ABI597_06415 [Gammaproteobacteria bacterium]
MQHYFFDREGEHTGSPLQKAKVCNNVGTTAEKRITTSRSMSFLPRAVVPRLVRGIQSTWRLFRFVEK